MEQVKGGICVQTEHIFPIIKKWLYSEKDIFLREIVSNACDACTKLKRLYSLGEAKEVDVDALKISVELDEEKKCITVTDNGIGMTFDEVQRYLNQIALSGALDFIEKYDEQNGAEGIIGHFGLGFYSAFMVSDKVEVLTRSHTGAEGVFWSCNGEGSFEMEPREGLETGTSVTMYISDEEKEFLDRGKIASILAKYCAFLPVPVYFDGGEKCQCDHDHDEKCDHGAKMINDTTPLWMKNPSDCTKEEYDEFYKKLTGDYKAPLFHIHLNADYPLNFKGILYFPKYDHEYENLEGQVKLYYNQVFVADNVKEVIPDYMIMLRGVLDCPQLPLNVSRSYLQNDAYTAKLSAHIAKKVADKLSGMFNTARQELQSIWSDIKPFVIYGSLRDEKFYDKVKGITLFKTCDGEYLTLSEYKEKVKEVCEGKLFYTTDKKAQAQYISLLSEQNIPAVLFDTILETQYISLLEHKGSEVKFYRVDAELPQLLKGEDAPISDEDKEALVKLFSEILGEGSTVTVGSLKNADVPAVLTVSEDSRRMNDMLKMYRSLGEDGGLRDLPESQSLVLNGACPIIAKLMSADEEKRGLIARHTVYMAKLARRPLTAEEAADFAKTAKEVMTELLGK